MLPGDFLNTSDYGYRFSNFPAKNTMHAWSCLNKLEPVSTCPEDVINREEKEVKGCVKF